MTRIVFAVCLAGIAGAACLAPPTSSADLTSKLTRVTTGGPYLAGATEVFELKADGLSEVVWSASAGSLNTSGLTATWTLPGKGVATLQVSYHDATGPQHASWDFEIISHQDNAAHAHDALLANPIVLVDGGTATTGSFCTLEYDSSNNIHLAFREDDHPSLYYAKWNGTAWAIELVDGMGFTTGGLVASRFTMQVDGTGNPHLLYRLEGKELRYATKSGNSWTRERVDGLYTNESSNGSLALNPALSNRATVVYNSYNTSAGYTRQVVAERLSPGTWTNSLLLLPTNYVTTYNQRLAGDLSIDAAGGIIWPFVNSYDAAHYLARWAGTGNGESVDLAPDTVPNWLNAAWGGTPSQLLFRTQGSVRNFTLRSPFNTSTATTERVEVTGASYGDIAWRNKPYVLHTHGSNIELVTTDANNYWTYTLLSQGSTSSTPSIAVSSGGVVSICYQYNGRIMFQ